ncbi:MAG TPA: bifunctional nuclease domain-containing protein [Ktedonosporobacter sp.]|jgi:RNA polymerase sigma factor (sigma-70 family)|nr:bifunctional nuclease domain-containing protein [Ktedonosporobacter sp.]
MEEETDAQLVARARADDAHAFRSLVERYQSLAFYLALRMVGQEEVAHDLVQESLLQAYLSLDRLRDDARFKSWLYGIVLNLCRNWRRLHPTNPLSLDHETTSFEHPLSADPQEIVEERELKQAVRSAIGILTPKNQAVAFLFYCEDLSMQEIANSLAISLSAVKNRLHKGRQQLQAYLQTVYADILAPAQSSRTKTTRLRLHLAKVIHRQQTFYESRYLLLLNEQQQHAWIPYMSDFKQQSFRMDLPAHQETTSAVPGTNELLLQMIHALEGRIEEISIEELYEDLLYARVTLRGKNGRRTVKARVDDALRLFILEQPPIFMDAAAFAYQSIALADYGQTQEQQLATLEQLVLDSPYLLHTDRRPDNLDFRQDMRGWMAYHARATLDTQVTRSGKPT